MSLSTITPAWHKQIRESSTKYKVVYGGRASGKSTTIAIELVMDAFTTGARTLCLRRYQNSVMESSKMLIEHVIRHMGVEDRFTFTRNKIVGDNGSVFEFSSMRNIAEHYDNYWVEEATEINAEELEWFEGRDANVYITFNPRLETDPVYRRFVADKPESYTDETSTVIRVNWNHNPWFPEVAEAERQRTLQMEPERYKHVWEGEPV